MESSWTVVRIDEVISKVAPLLLAFILLIPFIIIFWRMALYQPRTDEDVRAGLEKLLDKTTPSESSPQVLEQGIGAMIQTTVVKSEERVCFNTWSARWLRFIPRRWVGVAGITAVVVLLGLVGISTWFRSYTPTEVRRTLLSPSPTPTSGVFSSRFDNGTIVIERHDDQGTNSKKNK